jgi:hypothetical protein
MTLTKVEEAIAVALALGFVRVPGNDRYVRCQASKGERVCGSLVIVAHAQCRHLEWAGSGRTCLCSCHATEGVA